MRGEWSHGDAPSTSFKQVALFSKVLIGLGEANVTESNRQSVITSADITEKGNSIGQFGSCFSLTEDRNGPSGRGQACFTQGGEPTAGESSAAY